ncbi:hypothetical protein H4R18_004892 [Coemansia javaensis]|uniref:Malonyl-CoA decarboxylase n=1 Tax=Coemansia javaensis TaxID=2761396 RepID=A0A9W8LG85_9FUNG|nr:hypothetical protein H4R18_004892 [Coemansia javaensis]
MLAGLRLMTTPWVRRAARAAPAAPAAQLRTSAGRRSGAPPARDGDELSQPLEPADARAFWDNMRPGAQPTGALSAQAAGELRGAVEAVVRRRAHNGAVAMEQRTQQCCDQYEALDAAGRGAFLRMLAHEFCAPKGPALEAARAYVASAARARDPAQCAPLARALRDGLTPQYTELFDQINRLPGGFAFLVRMRGDMLALLRTAVAREDPPTRAMSDALKMKLETWIIGTLELKRITWNSPACTIEKLGQYETVHAVRSWLDVKRRLGSARRCFGFFHRSVPMEPLVFVWVALTDGISDNVQAILREREPPPPLHAEAAATCAVFYSINSQPGLSGVDLGNFLIKRVVAVLRAELPAVDTFCTLSPLPRFRAWLDQWLTPERIAAPPAGGDGDDDDVAVPPAAQQRLTALVPGAATWTAALARTIDARGWASDPALLAAMEPVVCALGAHYLVRAKRPGAATAAYDPVANFHLRNGACLHRINWRGNTSYSGLRQSLGLMCNYNYVLSRIEDNNERYVRDGSIAVSGSDPFIARAMSASPAPPPPPPARL